MNKLLTANFTRLAKDKVFWIGMIGMFALGIYVVFRGGPSSPLDGTIFVYAPVIGILSSAFCSLFIGTEYGDGTIRNKLIIGHTRDAIYLSNLIVCSAAGILMCLSYIAAASALGFSLRGFFQADIKTILILFLISLMMVVSCTAIFTLLCMLNQNKAAAAVICILCIIILLGLASTINTRLQAPEFIQSVTVNEKGAFAFGEAIGNPDYLRGTERMVYQFFLDFLPTGQAIQISSMTAQNLWQMPLYSLLITLAVTVGGILCFRRKNIK